MGGFCLTLLQMLHKKPIYAQEVLINQISKEVFNILVEQIKS